MADNQAMNGTTALVATDEVTYSGDVASVQLVRVVDVTGAEGSKTVTAPPGITALEAEYWPGYSAVSDPVNSPLHVDPGGALITRGAVTTDEGTFRCNFANTSLAVGIGSVTVSGNVVTGTGFVNSEVHYNDYFKLAADGDSAWLQIANIDSNTQLTLVSNYVGGSSGTGQRALVQPFIGTGGSLTVASGVLTIGGGTTTSSITGVKRLTDYAPLVYRCRLSISQRIANQEIHIGLEEDAAITRWFARFLADGTTNTTIKCESGRNPTGAPSASETETTTVTLPNGLTTASMQDYRIEVLTEVVRFYLQNVLVAQHTRVIPSQHDEMTSHVEIRNGTSPGSNTNILIDYITGKNHNKLEIGVMSDSEQIIASQPNLNTFNFNQAGVIAINTDILIIPCSQFRTINLQATSIGTTGRLDFFTTNDLSVVGTAQPAYPIGGAAAVTTTTAAGMWNIPTNGAAFLRVRMGVATTAGTTTIFATGSQAAHPIIIPSTQPISGTVTVNALPAGTNLVGDLGGQPRAGAGGLALPNRLASAAAGNNGTIVKSTAGRVYKITGYNNTATIRYLKLYNSATVTVGTTAVVNTYALKPNDYFNIDFGLIGQVHATGICYSLTTGVADNDTGALTAGDIVGLNVWFA